MINDGWLVVSTPSEKWWSERQLGWLYIPNMMGKITAMFPKHRPQFIIFAVALLMGF